MGRTARGIDGRGHALLILRPEELGFLRFLKQAKVTIKKLFFISTHSWLLMLLTYVHLYLELHLHSIPFVQVPLSEFEFSWSKISDIQSQVSSFSVNR